MALRFNSFPFFGVSVWMGPNACIYLIWIDDRVAHHNFCPGSFNETMADLDVWECSLHLLVALTAFKKIDGSEQLLLRFRGKVVFTTIKNEGRFADCLVVCLLLPME